MGELNRNFSALSLNNGQGQIGRKMESSLTAGWTSLLVEAREVAAVVEPFETSATPDLSVVLLAKGMREIESFSGGKWKKAVLKAGDGGMTAGGRTNRLRLSSPNSQAVQTINLYIPTYYLAAAAAEYRRAGSSSPIEELDTLAFTDPIVVRF